MPGPPPHGSAPGFAGRHPPPPPEFQSIEQRPFQPRGTGVFLPARPDGAHPMPRPLHVAAPRFVGLPSHVAAPGFVGLPPHVAAQGFAGLPPQVAAPAFVGLLPQVAAQGFVGPPTHVAAPRFVGLPPHVAAPGFVGLPPPLPPEHQPPATGPLHQQALAHEFEQMRLHDGPSSSSAGEADDAASDSSDDFEVIIDSTLARSRDLWSGGVRRAERLDRLSERVASLSTAADAQALIDEAHELRRQTADDHPITFATDFSEVFGAFALEGLSKTVFKCEDAGFAWQNAADHYRAAIDVARKAGLPADNIGPLDEAAAHCDAQTARCAVKASLLAAVTTFKRFPYFFKRGSVQTLENVLIPLRAALEQTEATALRALPLDSAPITGFDDELRAMADIVGNLSSTGPQAATSKGLKEALSGLEYVLSALPLVLRGEENVPALLAALRSALETPTERAHGLLVAAQARESDASRSLESLTDTFDSWYQTAVAYDEAVHTFDDITAPWTSEARAAPQAQALRMTLDGSRSAAVRQMNEALVDLFAAMSESIECFGENTDGDPSEAIGTVTAPELLIGADVLSHCEKLQAKLEASPFLRDATDIDAGRLAAPFAAMEQYVGAMLSRDENLLQAAASVRQAALTAESAVPAYRRVSATALREFSTLCAAQRRRLVNRGFQQIHVDAVKFITQESIAMNPALDGLYELRQSLPLVQFDPPPGERAAASDAPAAEDALIAATREAAQRVQAHIAQLPPLPADAAERIANNHAHVQLNLNSLATTLRTIAATIARAGEARRVMLDGPTADCTARLRLLADDLRQTGDLAADVLALGRSKRFASSGHISENAHRAMQFTRRVERTSRCIRFTLGVLADLTRSFQRVKDLSREPTLDPAHLCEIANQLTRDALTAVKDIVETRNQLTREVGTRHLDADAAKTAEMDIGHIQSFTTALEWRCVSDVEAAKRQWLRASVRALAARLEDPVGTVPPQAGALLDVIDEFLGTGTRALTDIAKNVADKSRLRDAFLDNNDIRREVQACRARLASRAGAPSGSGASKSKKASGKAKRK